MKQYTYYINITLEPKKSNIVEPMTYIDPEGILSGNKTLSKS